MAFSVNSLCNSQLQLSVLDSKRPTYWFCLTSGYIVSLGAKVKQPLSANNTRKKILFLSRSFSMVVVVQKELGGQATSGG